VKLRRILSRKARWSRKPQNQSVIEKLTGARIDDPSKRRATRSGRGAAELLDRLSRGRP